MLEFLFSSEWFPFAGALALWLLFKYTGPRLRRLLGGRRRMELADVASGLSMRFDPQPASVAGIEHLREFQTTAATAAANLYKGGGPEFSNLIFGVKDGIKLSIVDCRRIAIGGSVAPTQAVNSSLVILEGRTRLPQFQLSREHPVDVSILGTDTDIDFSEHPRFSGLFHLTGERGEITQAFHRDLISYLEDKADWFDGKTLSTAEHSFVLRCSNQLQASEIEDVIACSKNIYRLLINEN